MPLSALIKAGAPTLLEKRSSGRFRRCSTSRRRGQQVDSRQRRRWRGRPSAAGVDNHRSSNPFRTHRMHTARDTGVGGLRVLYRVHLRDGHDRDRLPVVWGTNVIDFVYFIAISMAGTIISGVLRLSHASWRKPITRIAEMITVAALPIGAITVMVDIARPDRMINLFLYARLQSPISWDTIAIGTYFIASLIYFFLPLIPDLAILRERMPNVGRVRRFLYTRLSFHWRASEGQVHRLNWGITAMAVIIVPLAVCVHSVLGWIYAVTLRAGVGGSTVFSMTPSSWEPCTLDWGQCWSSSTPFAGSITSRSTSRSSISSTWH